MNTQSTQRSVPLSDYLYRKAAYKRIPLSGTFELSPVCNFACRMCYVRKTAQEVQASLRPILTLEQWLQIAREARERGMLYLLLTGGEPLLWPDFWALYEELIKMGFLVSINTNGSLIDDQAVERFRKMPPQRINLTLYGASDETYERLCGVKGVFSNVSRAINALVDAGIFVKLNGTFTPHNVGDMERLVAYAQERKLILQTTSYMFPPVRRDPNMIGTNERFTPEECAQNRLRCYQLQYGEEQYRKFLQNVLDGYIDPPGLEENCIDPLDGRIRCRAGKAVFWVTWDGWLMPCGLMSEPKVEITKRNFGECWRELTQRSAELKLSGLCGKCPNQDVCHPCAAMAQAETGSSEGIPTYLCSMTREMQRIAAHTLEIK